MISIIISAIVESLAGLENHATDYVNVNRIPLLYGELVASLQTLNFTNVEFARSVSTHTCMYEYKCIINILLYFCIYFQLQSMKLLSICYMQLITGCGVSIPGKRSSNIYHPTQRKRTSLDVPNVTLNQTLFDTLERSLLPLLDNTIFSSK